MSGAGDVDGDGYADVVVGAPLYDAGEADEGAAFVFAGGASGVADGNPATAFSQLESDQPDAQLGTSVSGAGDVNGDGYADVVVGAPLYDAGEADEGAAFVFLGGASGIASGNPSTAHAQLESDQVDTYGMLRVAGAGDVNGDGYADVVVGSRVYDAGELDEGAAFVFLGSASGIAGGSPATAHAQIESDQEYAYLGVSVSGAGDVNGDGYGDLIVGANAYHAGETSEGAAFIFLGSPAGIEDGNPLTAHAQLESDQAGAGLGISAAGAGDVNGDGYGDVIVSASAYDAGEENEGAAFLFLGSDMGIADGSPATAHAQLESNQVEARLTSVAGAGDVNGDGYGDVIVGVYRYDAGEADEGAAFVFLGSASGIADGSPASADVKLYGNLASAELGRSVDGAGDVNGDGYGDVIVGAPKFYAPAGVGQYQEGGAFLFLGSASGIAPGLTRFEANQGQAHLGQSVSGAGDVNGDGYADVVVGAPAYDAGEGNEGAAFLFLGSASGIADGDPATADGQLESNQVGAELGDSVSRAGDVNGDGYADVIVTAPSYDAAEPNVGAAFIFLGNSGGLGRPVAVQQLRGDGSGVPVQPWGGSVDEDAFQVEMTATHPEGRGRVKLEVEACPAGLPFGDPGCTSHVGASWSDVTATPGGVRLAETLSGLTPGALYRWRARVLYAPFAAATPSPNPAHGPWRRLQGQAEEADILVPEPAELLLLVSGLAGLSVLDRRRKGVLRRRRA